MRSSTFRFLLALILVVAAGTVGAGCSGETVTTTSLAGGDPGVTPSTSPGEAPSGEVILALTADAFTNLDPPAASSTGDLLVLHQIYDWLVEDDGKGGFQPDLATSWEQNGPTVWSFTLRPNVAFQDGDPLDVEDVVHTFERLRLIADSSGLDTPLADFGIIESVVAVDSDTVRFSLTRPDADFLALLAQDAAAILSAGVRDPSREWVGTGPFALWSYASGQGAVLKKNPTYWMRDAGGRQLPYLDGVNIFFESDPQGRLSALTAGRVHFVGGLDSEGAGLVRGAAGLAVLETPSNEFLSVDIASAPGRPGENELVRRALKLGTDRAALAEAVRPSLAAPGNDSPVGPLYGERHLDVVPRQDTDAAKLLLTQAGVTEGLQFALEVPDDAEAQVLAEAWRLQMEAIGVTVEIRDAGMDVGTIGAEPAVPDGTITRWPSEMSPLVYLEQGYPSGSGSGDARWGDPDLDAAIADLALESDEAARVTLYHQIQQILIDRGPSVVPFYETAVAGVNDKLRGVTLAPYWPRTTFRTASFG